MATAIKQITEFNAPLNFDVSQAKVSIVVAEWNHDITHKLLTGAYQTLLKAGVDANNIKVSYVPGAVELTFAAQMIIKNTSVQAIICLGCVIQGETKHFDYVCQSVTQGITYLNATETVPVIFGVLTTDNLQQAIDRAGGKYGNKGEEAAITALKMIKFKQEITNL